MHVNLNFFSWIIYLTVAAFFIGISALTLRNWIRHEFVSYEFPVIVLLSSLCLLAIVFAGILRFGNVSGYILSEIGFVSMPVLFMLFSDGNRKASMKVCAAVLSISFIYVFVCIALPLPSDAEVGIGEMLAVITLLISILTVAGRIKKMIADMRQWMYRPNISGSIGDMVNFLYLLLLLIFQSAGIMAGRGTCPVCRVFIAQCLVLMLGLYSGICIRLSTGKIFIVLDAKEEELREMMQVYSADAVEVSGGDVCYKVVFDRLVEYFDKERPFLDGNLNIAEVSRKLLTNKAYLSRAINKYTGRNFCQYVNYYRIRHSVQLFSADPSLRIADLAARSGFHSLATFGMAFRLYMNDSPGEWCRKNREIMMKKP